VDIGKILHEGREMAGQLPDNRFSVLVRLAWGCVIVAGLFGSAALLSALPWERLLP